MSDYRRIVGHWALFSLFVSAVHSVSDLSSSKRGLAFNGDDHDSDVEILISENSTIAWYYTWSLWPSEKIGNSTPFVPLIHGLDDASDSELVSRLNSLPTSSTHLLSFNEPDGETDTGGSSISPEKAARSYMSNIAPLRKSTKSRSRKWAISYPSVTGSSQGLDWLSSFNETCYEISDDGCPMDFIAVHWYGDFSGLKTWLEQLREFYNGTDSDTPFWITEMALPKQDTDETLAMMNESIKYLDSLDYVEGYAWFGAFRSDEANGWTGDSVSLFDDDGGLTELGALYLGGEEKGFKEGESAGFCWSPPRSLMLGVLVLTIGLVL
ncbi:hypothetical protein AK830_g11729 [Neonectria ditissima]|uniref:Asl1-like glycosyl hydrolase catalytic domain-containing protein n=1 Tax=Neonectria ditissima TaxID=78410 RepID=A0A0P7AQR9_9HYPO|nr:hypothetical protein AK830_g11729 [Neonectria ditissima]